MEQDCFIASLSQFPRIGTHGGMERPPRTDTRALQQYLSQQVLPGGRGFFE
jgi:hypothetical protein